MNIKELFGMQNEDEDDTGINVNMANVRLPLDLALGLVFRQQQILFQALNDMKGQIGIVEQVLTNVGEEQTHLRDYLLQLQTNLENAKKHPVEREDDTTEEKENKKDERPN